MTADAGYPEMFWEVVTVFDPDHSGEDYAYSVGLADRGLPELHMWARPSEGDDPGADWHFNPRENASIVNEFARLLMAGEIAAGGTVEREYDGGNATVTYRLGEPVAPRSLDAFQVADGATVIPLRWSLHRPAEGPLLPVTADVAAQLRADTAGLLQAVDPATLAALPAALRPSATADSAPEDISVDEDGPFGPASVMVQALCAHLDSFSAQELADFIALAWTTEDTYSPRTALGTALAVARPAGRTAAAQAAIGVSGNLMLLITGGDRPTRRWREAVRAYAGDSSAAERAALDAPMRNMLQHAVGALLVGAATSDLLSDETCKAAFGPFKWTRARTLDGPPDPAYLAPPEVLEQVRTLCGELDAAGLRALSLLHEAAHNDEALNPPLALLQGGQIVSAASPPPLAELLAGTTAGTALASYVDDLHTRHLLARAFNVITGLLALYDRLPLEPVTTLARVYEPAVPGLLKRVHESVQR